MHEITLNIRNFYTLMSVFKIRKELLYETIEWLNVVLCNNMKTEAGLRAYLKTCLLLFQAYTTMLPASFF